MQPGGHAAGFDHGTEVADESEARDVHAGVDTNPHHCFRGGAVEGAHHLDRAIERLDRR